MSAVGFLSSSLLQYGAMQAVQQSRQVIQQLGQDLQSGNLSAAQSDFASLTNSNQVGSTSSTQSSNSIAQEFQKLGQDLQSGNLSAAQQDYTAMQQSAQNQAAQGHHHGHHHHHGVGAAMSQVDQSVNQLGQALQSGNLSTAQQAYASLTQDLAQLAIGDGLLTTQTSSSTGLSVSA
jgi:hypothetical protein